MITVIRKKGEHDKQLLNRFIKKVARDGVLGEARRRQYFISKAEQRRLDKKKAIRKIQRKRKRR